MKDSKALWHWINISNHNFSRNYYDLCNFFISIQQQVFKLCQADNGNAANFYKHCIFASYYSFIHVLISSCHSRVDNLLMSRSIDPSQLLLDLGFGGPETSVVTRIPTRFFTSPSLVSSMYYVLPSFLQSCLTILHAWVSEGGSNYVRKH